MIPRSTSSVTNISKSNIKLAPVKTEHTRRVEGLPPKSKIKPASLTKSSGPNVEKDVVVKRRAITGIGYDDEVPFSGRKRSVRERLGSNVVNSDIYDSQRRNKRQQTESNSSQHGDDDRQVGRDDLRLKLMRKGLSQRSGAEQNGVDLREKLSRNSMNLPRYGARGHVPESRSRYDAREKVPESRSRYGLSGRVPETRSSTHVSRMPSARSADDLFKLESSRKPYSSWTADGRN